MLDYLEKTGRMLQRKSPVTESQAEGVAGKNICARTFTFYRST